jgi:hypothetical protein
MPLPLRDPSSVEPPPAAPPLRSGEATGQLPRIRDVGSTGNTGQFPAVRETAQPPAMPAPPASQLPAVAPAPQAPALPQGRADDTGQFRLSAGGRRAIGGPAQGADPSGSGEYSVAERLFAADPLPPAPATDERLPIFEAMESEWFRRRDEARAQAAQSVPPRAEAPASATPPVPAAPPAAPRAELPAAPALDEAPAPAPAPIAPPRPEPFAVGAGTTTPEPPSIPQPTPSAPATAAPTSAGEMPMESPLPGRQPAPDAPSTSSQPAGAGAAWSSPGDEGWRAAQAAAKPVAAGLTQKGLPKRVPKSNLVPGSAGGTGAAKATPPPMPARSAEEVRGKLSSFHRGLRQGRDAATGQGGEPSKPEGDEN